MSEILKPAYLIVDFSAGNIITHHLNYAVTYAKFLSNNGYVVKLVLPKYTPLTQSLDDFDIVKVLRSREYRFDYSKISISRVYYALVNGKNRYGRFIEYIVGRLITKIYLLLAVKALRKIIRREKLDCVIVFPSADLMAIRFLNMIINRKINIKKFYVRINAIDKNLIDKNLKFDGLKLLDQLLIKSKKIQVGCETKSLVRILHKRGKKYNRIHWIPLPSIPRTRQNEQVNIIGFLGGAKKRKGFDEIPKWVNEINRIEPSTKFLIQTSPFPWLEYRNTVSYLKKMANIELIDPVIDNEELFNQISRCTYVVTPYDYTSYNIVGSSIFYYASDFLIPTISYDGLGFSDDILEFNCGIVVSNVPGDLGADLFQQETKTQLIENLINYNSFRNNKNLLFLQYS